jgi:hypothetical protein
MIALMLSSFIACTPNDANVSGDWHVWLAANSSATVDEGNLSISDSTVFECSTRGWDEEKCEWDKAYIGQTSGGYSGQDQFIGGDCKMNNGYCTDLDEDGNGVNDCAEDSSEAQKRFNPVQGNCDVQFEDLYLENRGEKDCSSENENCCTLFDVENFAEDCEDITNADFHKWLGDDGYYGLSGDINHWRSEAIINSEGDLQLTVHVDLGEGEDFRFHFSIDPDFEPIECKETDDGEAVAQLVDGSNWVDEWSEDEDGYRIFYLNAGAYQVNPNDSENWWSLPRDMLSGFGFAKFAAEEFSSHPADYGNYDLAGNGPGFLGITDHEVPDIMGYLDEIENLCDSVYGDLCPYNLVDEDGDGFTPADGDCDDSTPDIVPEDCPQNDEEVVPLSWQDEMVVMAGAKGFEHKVEDNYWRPIDGTVTGLDGWMEVHSSWVRLKNGSKVEDDGTVTGDFQIFYDGAESGSRLLVRGEFKTTRLRADRWGYGNLEEEKRDQYDNPYCGGSKVQR